MDVFDFRERGKTRVDERTEAVATLVIGAAIEVHRHLGPGLPESSYRRALSHELTLRGVRHRCEVAVPVVYKGEHVGDGRIDLLAEELLVVELKAIEAVTKVHRAQALTYLRLLTLQLALVMNFNVVVLKEGLERVINTL
jgi:GxxExxY protein